MLRRWAPGGTRVLEEKLDAVGYGFFIPVFFVSSGMSLDLDSIIDAPGRLVLFFVLLLAVRGLPTLLIYRSALPLPQRVELTFLTATALPLLVALARIGLENGSMLPENAAALVGAGVLLGAGVPRRGGGAGPTPARHPPRRVRRQRPAHRGLAELLLSSATMMPAG